MKKRFYSFLCLVLVAVMMFSFAACNSESNDTAATKEPEAKATDEIKPTSAPTEAPKPTTAPTEVPPTPTKEPKDCVKVDGLDAIITSFDRCDDYAVQVSNPDEDEVKIEGPMALINSSCIIVSFLDDEEEAVSFSLEEYPYIGMLYRVGFGVSIGGADHTYATVGGNASTEKGYWDDIEYICDADWHLLSFSAQESFFEMTEMDGYRFYTNSSGSNLPFAIGFLGAFKTEEDITKFYDAYVAKYGDKLVKSEPELVEKDEVIPDLEDAFDNTLFDFEDFSDGESMNGNVPDGFYWCTGANQSAYAEHGDGVAARLAFDSINYRDLVKNGKAYTLSLDFKNNGNQTNFGGIIINWGDENNKARNFFENNGLKSDGGGSLVSKSGIGLFFIDAHTLQLYVVTCNDDTAKLGYVSANLTVAADMNADYVKIVIADNGTDTITIVIADELVATISYSSARMLSEKVKAYNERYYRTVKVTDGSGAEVISTEDALVSYYKSIAFAGRAHGIYIDNVQVN